MAIRAQQERANREAFERWLWMGPEGLVCAQCWDEARRTPVAPAEGFGGYCTGCGLWGNVAAVRVECFCGQPGARWIASVNDLPPNVQRVQP
jgi:hypothetical protein